MFFTGSYEVDSPFLFSVFRGDVCLLPPLVVSDPVFPFLDPSPSPALFLHLGLFRCEIRTFLTMKSVALSPLGKFSEFSFVFFSFFHKVSPRIVKGSS